MNLISKGFFTLSMILLSSGVAIGWYASTLALPIFESIKNTSYGFYLIFFGIGLPMAILNYFEVKLVWSRLFKSKIDLLGVSVGLALGVLFFYRLNVIN